MPYKNPPPCQICGKPSAAKKLCDKHYRRMKKFGQVDKSLRPDDWGQRSKHELWQSWKWTARANGGRVDRWGEFWNFVADVEKRPSNLSRLRRRDARLPIGPDNFFWTEPVVTEASQTITPSGKLKYMRDWRKANPMRAKHYDLNKRIPGGVATYEAFLAKQNGKCAICGGVDEWFSLAVDHCHEQNVIRGLLCSQCNRGLGLFRDNPDWLRNAATYLEEARRLL